MPVAQFGIRRPLVTKWQIQKRNVSFGNPQLAQMAHFERQVSFERLF